MQQKLFQPPYPAWQSRLGCAEEAGAGGEEAGNLGAHSRGGPLLRILAAVATV